MAFAERFQVSLIAMRIRLKLGRDDLGLDEMARLEACTVTGSTSLTSAVTPKDVGEGVDDAQPLLRQLLLTLRARAHARKPNR